MRTSTSSLLAKAVPFFGEGRFSLKVLVTSASGLCEVTTGLAAEELLEAPIVDLWVTMRSSSCRPSPASSQAWSSWCTWACDGWA